VGVNLGDCIKIKSTITDEDGSPLTPDSHEISLLDSSENLIEMKDNPDAKGGGVFEVEFHLPTSGPVGVWEVEWQICTGGNCNERERFTFWVSK